MAFMPKSYDKIAYQLVEDGKVVGQAMQTNDQWGLYDLDRKQIGRLLFDTPEETVRFDAMRAVA
jgi:hypothetical protein